LLEALANKGEKSKGGSYTVLRLGALVSGAESFDNPCTCSLALHSSELKDFLQKLSILSEFEEHEAEEEFLHSSSYVHKYDENLDGIRSMLQHLVGKLASGRRSRRCSPVRRMRMTDPLSYLIGRALRGRRTVPPWR
jgi:hypothetical protein